MYGPDVDEVTVVARATVVAFVVSAAVVVVVPVVKSYVSLQIADKIASTNPVYTRHLYARMRLPRVVLSGDAEAVVSAKAVEYCIYRTRTQKGILCLVICNLQSLYMTCQTIVMMSAEQRNGFLAVLMQSERMGRTLSECVDKMRKDSHRK